MQVFISHSSLDKPFVRKLASELEKNNIKVWLDEVEIRVGHSISKEISNAIAKADIFCYVISKNSIKSGWVEREFSSLLPTVISGAAFLLPCKIDNAPIPTLIQDIKYADFQVDFQEGLTQLLKGLRIKDEIEKEAKFFKARTSIINTLNKDEVRYFLSAFANTDTISFTDFIGQRPMLFDKLCDLDVLVLYDGIYILTSFGREIYSEINSNIDNR